MWSTAMTTPDIEQPESASDGLHETVGPVNKQVANPHLESLGCLDARLVELDLLEQYINAHGDTAPSWSDLNRYKARRLKDLTKRTDLVATHSDTKNSPSNPPQSPTSKGELEKLLIDLVLKTFKEHNVNNDWLPYSTTVSIPLIEETEAQIQAYIDKYYIRREE